MGDADPSSSGLHQTQSKPSGGSGFRERSTKIYEDPKFRELNHYQKSHDHEKRLRAAAELEERAFRLKYAGRHGDALRSDGCDTVNDRLRLLAVGTASLPHIGSRAELPSSFLTAPATPSEQSDQQALQRRMSRFQTRLQWRDQMDASLRRLMQDMEFASDQRLRQYSHQARCDHLDKIYDWYITHGMKEARKERAGPPFIRYSAGGPVMPGSMRVAPGGEGHAVQAGLRQSSSSPTLLAAGSLGVESASASPRALGSTVAF